MSSTIGIQNLQKALEQALTPSSYAGVVGTGSTATQIVDAVGGWAANQWANWGIQFTQDTLTPSLRGVWQQITSNTSNTLTLAAALPAAPVQGDTYNIRPFGSQVMDVQAWGQQNVAAPLDDNSDGVAAATGGIPRFLARLTAWTGSAWSRLKLAATGSLTVRDDATGTPAQAAPGSALQVGVTDGANLRALAGDASGVAKVQGGYTEANPGTAAPSRAVQVGGSDGANLRTLRTDPSGDLAVWNEQAAGPSTTTALAASATYTSTVQSGAGFARITGTVFADQAGDLYVDQSPDGTNWDVSSHFAVAAGAGQGWSVEIVAPNWRLRYVNGATAQTVFRLYSWKRRI